MSKRWTYSGDMNLENGGTFFHIAPDDFANGYCDAVRVTPCSDGGGQENAWWVEALTLLIPDSHAEMQSVLSVCGWRVDSCDGPHKGAIVDHCGDVVAKKGTAAFRRVVAEACLTYGKYDPMNCYPEASSVAVQIGKEAEGGGRNERVKPDVMLRRNASLERFLRNFMRRAWP